VDFEGLIKYFSFFGAILACVLGVLRIIDYFKNNPRLLVKEVNSFYQYTIEEGTQFISSLQLTNIGRRNVFVKDVVAYLLSSEKKELTISGNIYTVGIMLEPNAYHETNIDLKLSQKMPKVKYFIKAVIRTTHKDYIHYIPMAFFDDWVEPIYKLEEERRSKGLLD
jgi:hypothetical protein